jgi:ATP-dependent protease ClpP protease subunit
MTNPNQDYRANPTRAVYVHGPIDEDLVRRLTPDILRLQHESPSPITVYIDSPGGSIASYQSLWNILTVRNQDLAPPCKIITVVTSEAASAAADLLVSGDYAIAYPEARILYHGVSTLPRQPLTTENISSAASNLRAINQDFAASLMDKLEIRFMFRFFDAKNRFDTVRKGVARKGTSAARYYEEVVYDSLSERARTLFEAAKRRHGRYQKLLGAATRAMARPRKTTAETEASIIRAIVDFEVKSHKNDPDWTFAADGLATLSEDFLLLGERLSALETGYFDQRCIDAAELLLDPSEMSRIARAPADQRDQITLQHVRPILEPVWSFFAALCHALQEGEHELTAKDAFHLGLVDEIMGLKGYAPYRYLMEPSATPSPTRRSKTKGRRRSLQRGK